ncbi:MAG: MFS transporter [Candidatus Korarchaeota archaeon]|nr:MFS transporter [Candidatus Korarchaeota archaeon]NIU84340.1 MFS transporter [Candidatus Thorarchaeota archaeon]NIW14459.1 MFS transporter [Candidatus Thorarchaeota archaeon]NIW52526.1 MFS transporter [Candidatus Korarchaeota archaeon]
MRDAKKKRILIWMCFSLFVCYLPWYNFSAMIEQITQELALSSREIGQILAGFQFGYVIIVIFSGWLGDKLGTKRVILSASLLTGVFAVLTPLFSVNLFTLMLFRIATGCASGAIYAPGMALLSNWYLPEERGFAVGAYTASLVSSYAVSYLTGGYLVTYVGWRIGMLLSAFPSFAGVVAVHFFVDAKTPQKGIRGLVSATTLHLSLAAVQSQLRRIKEALQKIKRGYLPILSYLGHMWELYSFWG